MKLNEQALIELLAKAPMEFTAAAREAPPIITLPMPDGELARFRLAESPVMEPGLAEKYPELKTYRAQGIDDPSATLRFDWLPTGFHPIVLASSGTTLRTYRLALAASHSGGPRAKGAARRPGRFPEVIEDLAHGTGFGDEGGLRALQRSGRCRRGAQAHP